MIENINTEFKRQYSDNIKYTVLAFANTNGGKLYIGIDDDGTVIGVHDIDGEMLRISNMIRDSIRPDITMFTDYEMIDMDGKSVILVTVNRGTLRPYYLEGKGIRPEGIYVRQGASSVPASSTAILEMIKESSNDCFETAVSINQSLTFNTAESFFTKRNQAFGDAQKRTLNLIDAEGRYTNLGLLLSDQCEHTIKFASFQGKTKSIFKNRKEFTGSIFKQIEECLLSIDQYNQIRSEFGYMDRVDRRDYPIEALREALFNCVVHRDYSLSGPILVSVFDDRIEMVNLGGLVKGINYGDLGMGVSQLRNKNLACIFYRLTLIESYGTGIPKINDVYGEYGLKAQIDVSDNAFKITLPNVNYQNEIINSKLRDVRIEYRPFQNDKQYRLEQLFAHRNTVSRSEIQNELGISQAGAILLIRDYLERGILEKENTGRYTRYKLVKR